MQIEIRLACRGECLMEFDYLYALHSALMNVLTLRKPNLATELHDGIHKNKLKMFVFSPLNSSPKPKLVEISGEKRKRMLLQGRIWLRIASPVPEFLNGVGEGLLTAGKLNIKGREFQISSANIVAPPRLDEEMVWKPFGQSASICTSWTPRNVGKKYFLYPDKTFEDSPACAELLAENLAHKFQRLLEWREDIASQWLSDAGMDKIPVSESIKVEFLSLKQDKAYRTAIHRMKNTTIRSWRCPVKVKAPIPVQRMIWAAGLGEMNSQGFGLMEEGKK